MAGQDVERANRAARSAGVKWPEGKKPFHDWLSRHYRLEKENQSFEWLRKRAQEFLSQYPKYRR